MGGQRSDHHGHSKKRASRSRSCSPHGCRSPAANTAGCSSCVMLSAARLIICGWQGGHVIVDADDRTRALRALQATTKQLCFLEFWKVLESSRTFQNSTQNIPELMGDSEMLWKIPDGCVPPGMLWNILHCFTSGITLLSKTRGRKFPGASACQCPFIIL